MRRTVPEPNRRCFTHFVMVDRAAQNVSDQGARSSVTTSTPCSSTFAGALSRYSCWRSSSSSSRFLRSLRRCHRCWSCARFASLALTRVSSASRALMMAGAPTSRQKLCAPPVCRERKPASSQLDQIPFACMDECQIVDKCKLTFQDRLYTWFRAQCT